MSFQEAIEAARQRRAFCAEMAKACEDVGLNSPGEVREHALLVDDLRAKSEELAQEILERI